MLEQYKQMTSQEYEKTTPLRVSYVKKAIVYPMENGLGTYDNSSHFGGVTYADGSLVELSETTRVSPPFMNLKFNRWYTGKNPIYPNDDVQFVPEQVVFLGAFHQHYGHFITESLARLWFMLSKNNKDYKCVYISQDNHCKYLDFLTLFGLDLDNLIRINSPTMFSSVIVPEPSIRLHDYYHRSYRETIDKIISSVSPMTYDKIYFSKAGVRNGRAIGESSIVNVFENNGYKIVASGSLSILKTLQYLKGCKHFASTSATASHNSIFAPCLSSCVCLNRSRHFHILQHFISRMRCVHVTYVDVSLSSSLSSFGDAPCLLYPSRHLIRFFNCYKFS